MEKQILIVTLFPNTQFSTRLGVFSNFEKVSKYLKKSIYKKRFTEDVLTYIEAVLKEESLMYEDKLISIEQVFVD